MVPEAAQLPAQLQVVHVHDSFGMSMPYNQLSGYAALSMHMQQQQHHHQQLQHQQLQHQHQQYKRRLNGAGGDGREALEETGRETRRRRRVDYRAMDEGAALDEEEEGDDKSRARKRPTLLP